MAKLEISFFSPVQVLLNSLPVIQFEAVNVRTLPEYMAAEAVYPQLCELLAALLCHD